MIGTSTQRLNERLCAAQVAHLIHALEGRGLLDRTPDAHDGRILRLSAITAGHQHAQQFVANETDSDPGRSQRSVGGYSRSRSALAAMTRVMAAGSTQPMVTSASGKL